MANVRTPAAPVHSSDLSASASTSARAATNLDTASAASPPSRTLPSAQSFQQLLKKDLQRTCDFFVGNVALKPTDLKACTATKIRLKLLDEYNFRPASSSAPFAEPLASVTALPSTSTRSTLPHRESVPFSSKSSLNEDTTPTISSTTNVPSHVNSSSSLAALSTPTTSLAGLIQEITGDGNDSRETHAYGGLAGNTAKFKKDSSTSYVGSEAITVLQPLPAPSGVKRSFSTSSELSTLTLHSPVTAPKPTWHAPWKLHRVISGHQGWVQCLSVDPTNEWFASGGNDRLLKIWDLASGTLKLTLTGHINTIRDLAISSRHPYLFSCAEDNRVKCWDLEQNKVVRDYHGHLSGVYCLALHPGIDILASGGRDAVVRVWDMRTKNAIYILNGHTGTIMSLQSQNSDPQLISGSQDKMIRLWDLKSGKCNAVLTHHKKSIRSMAIHPREYSFCSAASDNVKIWRCPEGRFDRNIEGHNAIINCCAIKEKGESSVLVAGTNNGQLHFWDWRSGHKFDTIQSRVQPGSLESENGIFAAVFDKSETRLITGECDKTIKIWKEDSEATPESNPIHWRPLKSLKRY